MRRDFAPAWFARGPHAQTVLGRLIRPRTQVRLERERLETPDGDELVLDHLAARGPASLHVILLHGLEGSSHSVYMQGVLSILARRGFSATAINFRSCARDPKDISRMLPNRRPRFYHSGETGDLDFVVRTLRSRLPEARLVAFGASLGGNALLKWLGEHPDQNLISAAATISVPYDLAVGAEYLERGAGPFYVARFLRTLKKKVKDVVERYPQVPVDLQTTMRSRTFREFDDAATAPLHGFKDASDYYARSSSIDYLGLIRTPTLCINAEDDPFLPREVLARARATASPSVELLVTERGGHTGFISGSAPWNCVYWAEELVVEWLGANIRS
ncbi:MAG TPA: alpha/beta fold hydrolase [Thermoanaerobaculia bacterium]|nr:alpha/beta fold hydrolase [Thermoanaerobaculia bacterium]